MAGLAEGVEEALADLAISFPLGEVGEGANLTPAYVGLVVRLGREAGGEVGELVEGEEEAWVMELSSLLRDSGCPHTCLVEGEVGARLSSPTSRLLLLHWLATEAMVARMAASAERGVGEEAGGLAELVGVLEVGEAASTAEALFKAKHKLGELVAAAPAVLVGEPAVGEVLGEEEWVQVEEVRRGLAEDYELRRRMLLARLDATVQVGTTTTLHSPTPPDHQAPHPPHHYHATPPHHHHHRTTHLPRASPGRRG